MTDRARLWMTAASVAVVVVDGALYVAGVINTRRAVFLLLLVETPLVLITCVVTTAAFRRLRRTGLSATASLEQFFGRTPVRLAKAEVRALRSWWLVARRRTEPVAGVRLSYGQGLAGTAAAFTAVTVTETVVLHVLLPDGWLRMLLTILSCYALVTVIGLVLSRKTYPHHIDGSRLHLRSGTRDVAAIDLSLVLDVVIRRRTNIVGLFPSVADGVLHLPSLDGTNLDLHLTRGLDVSASLRAPAATITRVSLHVDDPTSATSQIRALLNTCPEQRSSSSPQ